MQQASEATPSAMCSVVGCNDAVLEKFIGEILVSTKGQLQVIPILFYLIYIITIAYYPHR